MKIAGPATLTLIWSLSSLASEVQISIPVTGSMPTAAKMVLAARPIDLSCVGGFEAENWWRIRCTGDGSSAAVVDIDNIFNGRGVLHIEGSADQSLACRMLNASHPGGPVECHAADGGRDASRE